MVCGILILVGVCGLDCASCWLFGVLLVGCCCGWLMVLIVSIVVCCGGFAYSLVGGDCCGYWCLGFVSALGYGVVVVFVVRCMVL